MLKFVLIRIEEVFRIEVIFVMLMIEEDFVLIKEIGIEVDLMFVIWNIDEFIELKFKYLI